MSKLSVLKLKLILSSFLLCLLLTLYEILNTNGPGSKEKYWSHLTMAKAFPLRTLPFLSLVLGVDVGKVRNRQSSLHGSVRMGDE